jgi:hypothetical protein
MPRIANYLVLVDSTVTLDEEHLERGLGFILPSGAQLGGAVLAFVVNTIQPQFGFRILVNDDIQFTTNVAGNAFHSLHEIVRGLRIGTNNIVFQRLQGTFQISDVVLWFQQDI